MEQESRPETEVSGQSTENLRDPNVLESLNQMSFGLKLTFDGCSHIGQVFAQQLEQFNQAISQKGLEIKTAIDNFFKSITDGFQWAKNIDPAFLEAIKQKIKQIASDSKQVHAKLAKRAWFLVASEEIPGADMIALVLHLETGPKEVDEFMAKWMEDKLPAIQEILVENYPSRKQEIETAFRAHDRGEYCLSIPVFLRLSDGIYFDQSSGKYDGGVYSKKKNKNGKTGPEQYIEDLNIAVDLRYLFEPGGMITPLNVNSDQVDDPEIINRHAVAHGRSYAATKLNSLRAISWLFYWGTLTDFAQK